MRNAILVHSDAQHAPKKLARILAALSASPGRLNPCAKLCDSFAILLDPSLINADACEPALDAPLRNLSSMDIVEDAARMRW